MRFFMFPTAKAVQGNYCDCPCFCKRPLGDSAKTFHVEHWRGKQLLKSDIKVCAPCFNDLVSTPWSLVETLG